mmetsp:Transcript_27165/g.63593  ORF Transcript_27165/g.63593 Transcript_27165/m.63593 type:complete len:931 (-) Transcript_27165:351-3143(-)|eukprot:CAMPEP_0172384468 /NCGR_PEP_ID=MMETSP1061-20121228/2223_1 /TAXON_ID=37318 /ORGANISM="Pseudo-nitzschia pungens, Strain cf. pungens" /LENGTH=930 /DNA_ID=CAMNT_0013113097 /DNA_START=75 /DNA_END=2867 /DNA_ORIENTATION=+
MKFSASVRGTLFWAASACLLLSSTTYVSAKAILGVDLGSVYMKVALVQRGAPLEIVTNMHSKRKTEQMILFDQGTRLYGSDANSLLARKATKTPVGMSVMLGRDEDHPAVKVLSDRHFPLTPTYNETRKGLYLSIDGGKQVHTPEELTAMVLHYAEEFTHHYGKEKGHTYGDITDCVLTVPSFATQSERQALLDAAKLGGFKVLGLIDENTASALNFGMDKTFEEPKIYLFYNLGASALQVSIIKFHHYEVPESKYSKKTKKVGSIEVLGKGWDSTLGGLAYDNRLVEYMADSFNHKWRHARGHEKDIRDVPRAMTKIRLQANKVKHVLSANQEIPIHMDSLYDDISLSMHISRSQFEELCEDLSKRASDPIIDALTSANVTLEEIDAIEMLGGGMRVPKVQSSLTSVLGDKELGMHINSDESMALGAAFYGANISTAFRVRQVGLVDINPFPIGISLENLEKDDSEESWGKTATIFKANGKIGVKKTIAFTHEADVLCSLDYVEPGPDQIPEGAKKELQRYKITGVGDFAKEMEEKGLGKPKVSLQFELSSSGITSLVKAEAAVEEKYTVEVEVEIDDDEESSPPSDEKEEESTSKGKDDKGSDDATKKGESESKNDTVSEESSKEKNDEAKKKTKMVEKEKKKVHKKSLQVESYQVGKIQSLSQDLIEEYKSNIATLAELDKQRVLLEEAKNKLESYFYYVKNKLLDDEENINKISTEEQREELRNLSMEAEEWLFDDGDSADLETIEAKYGELATPAEKVWFRLKEMTERPAAVKALNEKLTEIEEKFTTWVTNMTHITDDEKSDVYSKIEVARKWVSQNVDAQAEKAGHEDPAFTSEEVPLQTKAIQKLIAKLSKKPKPKPPKVEKKETEKNSTEKDTSNEGGNETANADSEGTEENESSATENTSQDNGTTKNDAKNGDEEGSEL